MVVKNHEKLPTGNLIQLLKMAIRWFTHWKLWCSIVFCVSLPEAKAENSYPIEIVDLPIENCDVPSFFVLVCQRLRPKTATPRRLCSVTGHRFPSRSAWKWTMEFHVAKPGPLASWLQWLMWSKYMYTWCRLYIYTVWLAYISSSLIISVFLFKKNTCKLFVATPWTSFFCHRRLRPSFGRPGTSWKK